MIRILVQLATATALVVPVPVPTVSPWAETALTKNNPSYEFIDQSPVLISVFFQRFAGVETVDKACATSIQALKDATGATTPWEPWNEEELGLIQKCDQLPCQIKLNASEVTPLAAKPAPERFALYQSLIEARKQAYLARGERKPYEYEGGIQDPWAQWTERKWLTPEDLSGSPQLVSRRVDVMSSQARPIRQVLDVRRRETGQSFLYFNRDLYTDHYFDGWGEGVRLTCRPATKDLTFEAIQWVEFDLLKETDLLSRLSRPKMRSMLQDQQRKKIDALLNLVKKTI